MDESSSFLEEVLAAPEDDTPRLIYADWLEEQGSPRGEFIRVQCELDALDPLDPRYLDLQFRNEELLAEFGSQWAAELQQNVRKAVYTRGFVDTVTVKARTFLNSGDQLFASFPVRWLRLNYMRGTADQWATCEALRHVRFLDLADLKIPEADLLALLSSSHLCHLEGLKIGGYEQQFSAHIARVTGSAQIAGRLQQLHFFGTGSAVQQILESAAEDIGLPALRVLQLKSFSEQTRDTTPLSLACGPLEELDVDGPLSVADVRQLTALAVGRLQRLRITSLPATGLNLLSEAGTLDHVQQLDLPYGEARLRSVETLFRDQHLTQCHTLNCQMFSHFSSPAHADRFVELLAGHPQLRKLRNLRLSGLAEGHLQQLASSPHLQQLQALHLTDSQVGVEDLRALAQSPLAGSLRSLTMSLMCPSPQGFRELAAGHFPQLLQFTVDRRFSYRFSTKGVESPIIELIESAALPALQSLTLTGLSLTKTTPYAVALKSRLPRLRVFYFDENTASNDVIGTVLCSERLPHLRLFSLKDCRGLRRSQKMSDTYGSRLQY
ncbi:MAG: TIGR02996 domain-containing protein [Planctomycetaceae bacterium]|nr:TIGR02996 domain-containing protein [Planctomycetaceae bacterium]